MSEDITAPAAPAETYDSEVGGLRQAAQDLVTQRGRRDENTDPTKHIVAVQDRVDRDGFNRGVSPRDAAAELTKFREAQAEQQRAFDAALGIDDGSGEQQPPPTTTPQPAEAAPVDPVQQEVQEVRQQAQAELERARSYQENLGKLGHLHAQFASLEHQFVASFPEIKTAQDFQMLWQTNPQRAQQAAEYLQAAQGALNQTQRQIQETSQQEEAHFATAFTDWTRQQSKIFEDRHPEMKDRKVARQMGELALQELKAAGLSEKDLDALVRGKASISIQDHRAQEIILDAVRWRNVQRNGLKPAPKPVPHVQRPGVSKPQISGHDAELDDLAQLARTKPTVRNMARHLAAKRSARG